MKCVVCNRGETEPGTTTLTLERGEVTLLIRGVRAEVCPDCGEAYVDAGVTERILEAAEEVARAAAHEDQTENVAV